MAPVVVLDPLVSDEEADGLLDLWRRFGSYGQYSGEGFKTEFAPELAQRYDAAANFVRTGGRFGRTGEPKSMLARRTNYFRETYAYGADVFVDGIEFFRTHPRIVEAAREIHGRPIIVPAIVYANVLAPGQELAVHTDVGEFRGANRKVVPQWLIVVMMHSGLFDEWRLPIATAISYFGGGSGGELCYYPDGAAGAAVTYTPRHNTAVVLDTDTVFHGVDRVLGDESSLPALDDGVQLVHRGDGLWEVENDGEVVASYDEDTLRCSISWKAYCFADEEERRAWESHSDDLSLDAILDRLVDDLRRQGVLGNGQERPADAELGRLLIDTYIKFPEPTPV